MLWDLVFEFFVKYIFGGNLLENGVKFSYDGVLGAVYYPDISQWVSLSTSSGMFFTYFQSNGSPLYFSLGNYLSLIATIITMVVILVLCCALIKKIYNMCAHIIG